MSEKPSKPGFYWVYATTRGDVSPHHEIVEVRPNGDVWTLDQASLDIESWGPKIEKPTDRPVQRNAWSDPPETPGAYLGHVGHTVDDPDLQTQKVFWDGHFWRDTHGNLIPFGGRHTNDTWTPLQGDDRSLATPTIHQNGSGYDLLFKLNAEAVGSIVDAISKLNAAAPHGRDFYVQGPDALAQAMKEHDNRLERLRSVLAELETILEDLSDQANT